MKNIKKAQISVFVIVAVVIIVGIGSYLYYNDQLSFGDKIDPIVQPVYSFVKDCMEKTAKDAVLDTSKFGGYFVSPDLSLDNGIPYYFYNEKNYMPSKEEIQRQLEDYINNVFYSCVGKYENFEEYEINPKNIEAKATIKNEEVVFNIKYPLTIVKDENTFVFENFVVKIPARLGVIYDSIVYLMEDQVKSPKSICIACVHEISTTEDLYVNTLNYNNNDVIFTIKDENIKINNKALVFNFANQYEGI
jgi:hypothetical protein